MAADPAVQREPDALPQHLSGAYRDPHAAKARLDEMVKRQGLHDTAARVAQDRARVGDLRGKVGFFAGARAKAERASAERAADLVAPSLECIGAAEARAAQTFRGSPNQLGNAAGRRPRVWQEPRSSGGGARRHRRWRRLLRHLPIVWRFLA